MKRRLNFKPGLQEQIRQNQKGIDLWAAMAGRDPIDLGAKPKVERGPVNHAESEAPVLKGVGDLLAVHPKVAIAIRINSGMAYSPNGAPVWFHKLLRGDGVCTDYFGVLTDARPFAIECKRPDWKGVGDGHGRTNERERQQMAYINEVLGVGGVGGFACSVDDARSILES